MACEHHPRICIGLRSRPFLLLIAVAISWVAFGLLVWGIMRLTAAVA